MTLKIILKWMAVLAVGLLTAQAIAEETLVLKTQKDRESYAFGVEVVRNFKRQGIDFDLDVVIRGMKDALAGDKLLLTDNDLQTTLNMFASELRRNRAKARLIAAQDNKKEGEAFLAENKTEEGVVTLPSGLEYKILKAGGGKKPTEADTVECQYRGTLINGTEFDSSDRGGRPATFKVSEVIPGWREALKLMPVGSKWQLFIPPQLAYGQRGSGRHIGPNATLIFDIELVAVK
jgi:FKBP-type peptidyl-prolyl cis-trans isomerase